MKLTDTERRELEAEREFLLRSLADLDDERDAGNVDVDTYAVLHADYTARAAAAVRRLAGHDVAVTVRAERPPGSRRLLTIALLGALVAAITLVVVVSVAPRRPGQSLTGNDASGTTATTVDLDAEYERLQAAVDADADDFAARMDLGLFLFQQREYAGATEHLANATRLRPDDVEAQSFYGWAAWQLVQLAPEGDGRDQLVDIAIEHLAEAVRLAPDDLTANTFYGVVLFRGANDPEAAIVYLERAANIGGSAVPPMLQTALDEARAAATVPTSTTAS